MSSTLGTLLKLSTFGESHGAAIGGILDGFPPGVEIDFDQVDRFLARRKPGQSHLSTSRMETDSVEFLSGMLNGVTTGTPIAFMVRNSNQRSGDYSALKDIFRPSHADYTYLQKYGLRDHRGGGRQSARTTLSRCVAGALALQVLQRQGITVKAYTSQVGSIKVDKPYWELPLDDIESNAVRCPDHEIAQQMEQLILQVKQEGDSIGGIITCVVKGCPSGIGEPEFGKLHSQLGAAMLSINAAKAFDYGAGFEACSQRGSTQNDAFRVAEGRIVTQTNHSGGIQGGISNGEDIFFRVGFKPVPTIMQPQHTVNTSGREMVFSATGRHDPCVLPRAVPVVEATTALVLLDNILIQKSRTVQPR